MTTTTHHIPFNDLSLPHQKVIAEALIHYCGWLNSSRAVDDEYIYDSVHFLDTDVNPYADLRVHIVRDSGPDWFNGFYAECSLDDGDDGGPANLFIYADNFSRPEDSENYQIKFILQEFDTFFSVVYNEADQETP